MCGRYARRSDKQEIAEHFAVHGTVMLDLGPSWNVAPQTFQPIVRLNRDTGKRELFSCGGDWSFSNRTMCAPTLDGAANLRNFLCQRIE